MQYTPNYNLAKPELTDVADITKISDNMDIIDGLFKGIIDKLYPVNSIYLSTDSTNPGTILGIGTWVMIEEGRMLRSAGGDIMAGSTGGADSVTLSTSNLPAHNHTASSASTGAHTHTITVANGGSHNHTASTASAGAHTHTRGTMEIKGTFSGVGQHYNPGSGNLRENVVTGAFYRVNTTNNPSQGVRLGQSGDAERDDYFGFKASDSWSGSTSSNGAHTHTVTVNNASAHTHSATSASNGAHAHTITVNNTGSGTAVDITNSYYAVYMWKRTA